MTLTLASIVTSHITCSRISANQTLWNIFKFYQKLEKLLGKVISLLESLGVVLMEKMFSSYQLKQKMEVYVVQKGEIYF